MKESGIGKLFFHLSDSGLGKYGMSARIVAKTAQSTASTLADHCDCHAADVCDVEGRVVRRNI